MPDVGDDVQDASGHFAHTDREWRAVSPKSAPVFAVPKPDLSSRQDVGMLGQSILSRRLGGYEDIGQYSGVGTRGG